MILIGKWLFFLFEIFCDSSMKRNSEICFWWKRYCAQSYFCLNFEFYQNTNDSQKSHFITQNLQFYQVIILFAMNPENLGTHVSDRHSYLWRKSMFIEPRVPDRETCHKQMNQFSSTMNSSWRSRNNMIHTNFSHLNQTHRLKRGHSVVQDVLLREQKMQTKATKSMLKSLLIDKTALEKSNKLVEGMSKLKDMKLLTGKDLNQVKFPGVIKHQHIYNDYHERLTNPGFSRNQKGKFYTK